MVSHNRYFVDSFVNKVFEVREGRINVYEGNVSDYLKKLAEVEEEKLLLEQKKEQSFKGGKSSDIDSADKTSRKERKKQEAQRRQERSRLLGDWLKKSEEAERNIEQLEEEKEELEADMADPQLYSDEAAWAEVSKAYEACKRRLQRNYGRWEEAQEKIEEGEALLAAKYDE